MEDHDEIWAELKNCWIGRVYKATHGGGEIEVVEDAGDRIRYRFGTAKKHVSYWIPKDYLQNDIDNGDMVRIK